MKNNIMNSLRIRFEYMLSKTMRIFAYENLPNVIARIDGYASLLVSDGRVSILNDDGTVPLIGNCGEINYSLNPDYVVLSVPEPIVGKVYYYCIHDCCRKIMIEGYRIWDGEKFVPAHGLPIPPEYKYNYYRRFNKNNEE